MIIDDVVLRWCPVRLRRRVTQSFSILAAAVILVGGAGIAHAEAGLRHQASDEVNEVAFLVRTGTADSLATASLLTYLTPGSGEAGASRDPIKLMERALAKAPARPELVWLELRECQQRRCAEEATIAASLKALDPDNGLAWLPDLRAAQAQSAEEITKVVAAMGDKPKPTLYWNRLVVMMFDALTHRDPAYPPTAITLHADDRYTHVTGVLAAVDVPALQPLRAVCASDQFESAGRRAACEKLLVRLESGDSVIAQNLSVVLRQGWWSATSPEHETLRSKHRQQRYLMVESNQLREGQADRDADARVEAMRHLPREEDVEVAMLRSFNEPLSRPPEWKSPEREE
jgi:hypothetical protein